MMRWLTGLLCLLWSLNVHAHKPSDSYLTLGIEGNQVTGQWDIALRDLDFAIGLDTDADGAITWGELKARQKEIDAYALSRLQVSGAGQACPLRATGHLVDDHTDGAYAVVQFQAACQAITDTLQISYQLFFDIDPQHKGLLRLQHKGASITGIFSPENADQVFSLHAPSRLRQFVDYLREGVWHIWIGYDHILFLLGVVFFLYRMKDVGIYVSLFAIGHSVTMLLGVWYGWGINAYIIDAIIGLSVVYKALDNLGAYQKWFGFQPNTKVATLIFGLFHGTGLATKILDYDIPQDGLLANLLAFNVGVEVGQLLALAVILIVMGYWRRSPNFLRQATIANVVMMVLGIWLTFNQVAGYIASTSA